ncbi:MAG: aldehyde dehydrogenase (NADP(+)) [bacterium]|nr:aldehyde dehydrogenase (NADP(+)) [bacterium]
MSGGASDLTGKHLVAGDELSPTGALFGGINALTGEHLGPDYGEADAATIGRACSAAGELAPMFAASEPAMRAKLLRAIADGILDLEDTLVERVMTETALPRARVEAERGRTVNQLRLFAGLVEEGSWVDAHIDHSVPDRAPVPKPDLRRMLVGLGPVVVFGASNFPLAYSVAGGDTASALAAGCPVIVKAHPAHPGTSELIGRVIKNALAAAGLPAGLFALVHGRTHDVGSELVKHPAVKAVGFTGSHQGGRALFDLAAARPEPIPVFAEMGSMNPVVVLPRALAERGEAIGEQLVGSAVLASGQFCTSPGLVLWIDGAGSEALLAKLRTGLTAAPSGPTVHPTIRTGYERTLTELEGLPLEAHVSTAPTESPTAVCPRLLTTDATALQDNPRLRTEIYGPAVVAVRCRDAAELLASVKSLTGHLTATVQGDLQDLRDHADVVAVLRDRVGRLIQNGVPTGVEVCSAMVHGGPYPAATDVRFSAVGPTAIQRWARPVCWQDWAAELLPAELREDNPRGIRRTIDGELVSG